MKGFREFLLRGNVVGIAVAVVIGAAFGQMVNSFVTDILTPLIGIFGGLPDFSAIKIGPIALGKFINSVVNFFVVSASIYFIVVVFIRKIEKKYKKEEDSASKPVEHSEEVRLLQAILDELKRRNEFLISRNVKNDSF